jgi:spermidine/putrescine ABC transporter ATP-binding subunit
LIPAVEFVRVSKTFGGQRAVREVSFTVQPGEFFSLLGPSGCGKTTTLRMIAGFEQPDADGGEVRLGGKVVNTLRPYDRDLGMVFQSYALFPHLTVERNIAFGLEQRGVARGEIAGRVRRAMELVRMDVDTFARRLPPELSGGQRQRVALARALVVEPPILLLDEPLGALDLKLRKEMQLELKMLNKRLGITFVYVTHDQEEALTMSDRIAVMDNARVAQIGTPAEIYERPRTPFVARFIGESNFLKGAAAGAIDGYATVTRDGGGEFRVPAPAGPRVHLALRPERVEIDGAGTNTLPATVGHVVYRGEMLHVRVELDGGGDLTIAARNEGQLRRPVPWRTGDRVRVTWHPDDAQVLEEDPA